MKKSSDALRTISEVATLLDTPKHVLRFWESKFTQIRPMKRGGGRRYYRPADIELLMGIRHLLYDEGFTIRGVQQIFKREGVDYVKKYAGNTHGEDEATPSNDLASKPGSKPVSKDETKAGKSKKTKRAPLPEFKNVHPKQKILLSILDEINACRKILDDA